MSNLHYLVKSLVTVCVRYHHDKLSTKVPVEELVHQLLKLSNQELQRKLEDLNVEATKADATRQPVLNYILFEIKMLQGFIAQEGIPTEEDMLGIQRQLAQFFTALQRLQETSQGTELIFNYNNQEAKMYGLVRRLWTGSALSVCGTAIQEELFVPFRLAATVQKPSIEAFVRELFQTHCRDLLLLNLTTKNTALQVKVEELGKKVEEHQSKLGIEHSKLEAALTKLSLTEKELNQLRQISKVKSQSALIKYSAFPGLFTAPFLLNPNFNKSLNLDPSQNTAEPSQLQLE
jgi:hypothetical protein